MTKFQLMLTSLVAVIPGAFLIFVLVTAMLQYSDKMSTIAYIVVGGTLLSMVITVLMPLGILFGGGRKSIPPKAAAQAKPGSEPETLGDSLEIVDESSEAFTLDDDDSMVSSMDDSMDESIGDSSQSDLSINTSEFELSNSFDGLGTLDDESVVDTDPVEDFDDSFAFNDDSLDEVEEEPKPKKKKR